MIQNPILAVFTQEMPRGSWRLKVFPNHEPCVIRGLDAYGRVGGLSKPNLERLEHHMGAAQAGYQLRVHADGTIELSARDRSALALAEWLNAIVAIQEKT